MEEIPLPALFEQARKIYSLASESVVDQGTLRKGIEAFCHCNEVIITLGLFSANETRNYVSTANLKYLLAHSSPFEDPELSPDEKKLIVGDSISKEPVTKIPWRLILSKPPIWALIVSHFCHNWGTFILLTWMPTYYHQVNTRSE